jgi:hypothetical protein
MMPHRTHEWIVGLCLLACFGCAATPYQYGHFRRLQQERDVQGVVIEHGAPHKTLDRIAWIIGTPARILPLNAKINKHEISPETAETLKVYLEKNDLTDVYVYINHYDPSGQWKRLRDNTSISPFWRYSFGAFSMVGYTVLPSRVFGGDKYNPYTNALYLNSDVPAVILHEAAFAKDVHSRKLPGSYVAVNDLPVLSMWHEILAVNEVLSYARSESDWKVERETYRVMYPKMGAESMGVAGPLVTTMVAGPIAPLLIGPALGLSGAAVGHVTGRNMIARRDTELHKPNSRIDATPNDVQQAAFVNDSAPAMERLPKP